MLGIPNEHFRKKRYRTLNDKNQINQLFQGRNEQREGLRNVKGIGITLQLYIFDLEGESAKFENVPGLAIYIPAEIGREFIRWAE